MEKAFGIHSGSWTIRSVGVAESPMRERSWDCPVISRFQSRGSDRCSECAVRSTGERRSNRNIEDPVYPEKIGDVERDHDGNPMGQMLVLLSFRLTRTAAPAFHLLGFEHRRLGLDRPGRDVSIQLRDREASVTLAIGHRRCRPAALTEQIAKCAIAQA